MDNDIGADGTVEDRSRRSSTPPRPPYSPVTPTLSHSTLQVEGMRNSQQPLELIDEPEPVPLSLEDNPDAIALRAAVSILQLQRQQALNDIKQLDKIKTAALQDPEVFVEDLKAGRLSSIPPSGIVSIDESNGEDAEVSHRPRDGSSNSQPKFGRLPTPQNVVRTPPVNWAKYHIVGEPLDKLHEEQLRRPSSRDVNMDGQQSNPDHVIAAPYRPFVDKDGPSLVQKNQKSTK